MDGRGDRECMEAKGQEMMKRKQKEEVEDAEEVDDE